MQKRQEKSNSRLRDGELFGQLYRRKWHLARYGVKPEKAGEDIKEEAAVNLAKGLHTISLFYGPKAVCLGGGVINGWGREFVDKVEQCLRQWHSISPLMSCPKIYISALSSDTGLLGAAAVGFAKIKKESKAY